jgi:hypothetical protein
MSRHALLHGHCAYDAHTLECLPSVWRTLLDDAAINVAVVEDRGRPQDSSALAFGTSVFVTDPYMARERLGAEPYLTARAVQAELRGRSPILRSTAVGAGTGARRSLCPDVALCGGEGATQRGSCVRKNIQCVGQMSFEDRIELVRRICSEP